MPGADIRPLNPYSEEVTNFGHLAYLCDKSIITHEGGKLEYFTSYETRIKNI